MTNHRLYSIITGLMNHQITSYDVMTPQQRRIYLVLLACGSALVTVFFLWWFQAAHIPRNFSGFMHGVDILLFVALSFVIWYQITNEWFSWIVAGHMQKPANIAPPSGLKVAFLTAFVPGKEPYEMLEKTLTAMTRTHYPHDTWLLDEGNDERAMAICHKLGVQHFTRRNIQQYNMPNGPYKAKTKGGNYNSWFHRHGAKYDFVAQLDVDFVPSQDYLIRTLGYFQDEKVAFVGTPQIYGNTAESWIVRGAAEQAYNFYGSMQKGFFGIGMTLFIGANHVLRTAAHDSIEGYSGHIVEDHLTGMRFYANQWKSVYVPEILAVGEGPSTWKAYFSQQMRWAYGLIDILFRHSFGIFPKMRKFHIFNYFLLQQYYFYGIAQVLGILLLCLYFFAGIEVTVMPLVPLLALYISLVVFQQIFFVWLQRFNIDPQIESGLMLSGRLLNWAAWPVYFIAFVGVLINRRLTYVVTPKGNQQSDDNALVLFVPHVLLGTITLACLGASVVFSRYAPLLVFWAAVNTIIMYAFPFLEILRLLKKSLSQKSLFVVTRPRLAVVGGAVFVSILFFAYHQTQRVSPSVLPVISAVVETPTQYTPKMNTMSDTPRVVEHRVAPGESLWKISKTYYGKGESWKKIQHKGESTIIQPGSV